MIHNLKVLLLFKLQIEHNNRRELIEYCGQDAVNTLRYNFILLRIKWFEMMYALLDAF